MRKSRFSDEQIIAILREQEAGRPTAEVCRRHGISDARFEAEQQGAPADVEAARRAFLLPLIDAARDLLEEGIADIPCPSIRRPRAEARARRRFEILLRSEKTGFPGLFATTADEELPHEELEATDAQ